jgi:hypothetical protein
MKVSVTFHEEGTPIATVTFRKSRRRCVRQRIKYNRIRREFGVFRHWDEMSWVRERMRLWREHHNKGDTLA